VLKAEEVKRRIDIFDLADKLGLVQPGGKGNYKSPHHDDKSPSLQLFADGGWKDWSSGESGSVIDLVMYCKNMDFIDALEEIHDLYSWDKETKADNRTPQQKTLAENIADRSLKDPEPVIDYLMGRGINADTIRHAIKRKSIGWNIWTNDNKEPNTVGYGGPAAAFIVTSMNPGKVMAVDMRYQDPELNGGLKTSSQGEKFGYPWFMDLHRLKAAKTVYVVESAINALSIESCNMPYTSAVATRGTQTIEGIDWRFLQGKKVIACMDNDKPDDKGHRPGTEAAWKLYDQLTALNIACHFIDQSTWGEFEYNDVNDIIKSEDATQLKMYLKRLETWLIPGQPGKPDEYLGFTKPRVFLPPHDYAQYWRYRPKEDFTTYISKVEKDEDTGAEKMKFDDLCGFRVASISRVNIQSAQATMSGEEDPQPLTRFAVTVQIPRYGHKLQRKVFEDERLHNVDHWAKFGPVFARSQFLRMISILERAADIGARDAVNFVGLAWRNGKPVVNEGPDCYFNEPDKQCPYHNLTFPSGSISDAKAVIKAYQATFANNAASQLLVWSLGGHLKAFIGTWPHAILQASKGSGKSTLIKRLERTIAFTMFSGQSLQTEFRLLTSISHTSHPVGWEELSARRQDVIDKAVSMLQESYQFGVTRRGSDMTEYLQCAPVLLAGEDVPVKSLTGKLVRFEISGDSQGEQIPLNLPRFPLRQWLNYLVAQGQERVIEVLQKSRDYLMTHCAGDVKNDNGARRMVENYAGLMATWKLLADFAHIKTSQGNFVSDLVTAMNMHITETSSDREPWVWIIDTILNEISSNKFTYPYKFIVYREDGLPHECLLIRPKHIMAHISSSLPLREIWNGLPVKTDRVLKQQLMHSGVVFRERVDTIVNKQRLSHMLALSLSKMAEFNLHAISPTDADTEDSRYIDDGTKGDLFNE
jgi:hypothetical protein